MPKAGITVESCIIGEWLKNVGDQIKVGDILFTYETDKASFECESTEEGELLAIFYEAGDEGGQTADLTAGPIGKSKLLMPFQGVRPIQKPMNTFP